VPKKPPTPPDSTEGGIPLRATSRPRQEKERAVLVDHELRQYPNYNWDLDAIGAQIDKLMLAVGEGSQAAHLWTSRPSVILAERYDLPVLEVPGYHLGSLQDPAEFAARIRTALL
jgi:hypothetical protein